MRWMGLVPMLWWLGSQVLGQLKFCCGCCVWVLFLTAVAVAEEKTRKDWSVIQRVTCLQPSLICSPLVTITFPGFYDTFPSPKTLQLGRTLQQSLVNQKFG